jgi:hypothetical protein
MLTSGKPFTMPRRAVRSSLGLALVGLSLVVHPALATDAPEPFPGIELAAQVADRSLKATSKPADAGLEDGIHWVDLRIVDDLSVHVQLAVDHDMVLAEPPRLCLVGPFWNPLDAGLSDRCWGEPDLSTLIAHQLRQDDEGSYLLDVGSPISVAADLRRGDVRCDYPPGQWHIQLAVIPVIDGTAAERVYLPDVAMSVPVAESAPLAYLPSRDTRFCSYRQAVFLEQGEPAIAP